LQIRVISSLDGFQSLRNPWEKLLDKCDHTIFSTYEWRSIWWKHFGKDRGLLLLAAEENDKIVGIAPLMHSPMGMFGLKRGKIEFIGAQDSDYNDFIITEKRDECLKLFFEYLNLLPEKKDFVDLADIPQNAKCLPFLTKISKKLRPINDCPYLTLPGTYDEFLKMLSPKKRKYVVNGMKKLENDFEVEIVDCSQPRQFKEGMQDLIELHQKKWTSEGCFGVFSNQSIRDFHLEVADFYSRRKWLSLYVLKLSGKPVAAEYGFKYKSKYYAYLAGYDPDYSRYSVGNMLFVQIVSRLVQEGITQYDFLRGSEQYKDYWNALSKWNYEAILQKNGVSASFQCGLYNAYWNYGNRLKNLKNLALLMK
jgi:CelD/BcsL family acetyltransferase involved in cellulose biosynthesis